MNVNLGSLRSSLTTIMPFVMFIAVESNLEKIIWDRGDSGIRIIHYPAKDSHSFKSRIIVYQ